MNAIVLSQHSFGLTAKVFDAIPALWDAGIRAGLLDYNYNGYRTRNSRFGSDSSHYLRLRTGVNLGAWRLRYHPAASRTGANASWDTSRAQLGANLSTSRSSRRQYGVSLNGGVVAFGGGVILTPRLGDTIGIIEARDAQGVRLAGQSGQLRLNRRGHTATAYLQAYRHNRVTLDAKGLSTDVAIATTAASLADKGPCHRAADHAHDFRQVEAVCVSGILLSAVSGPLDGGR